MASPPRATVWAARKTSKSSPVRLNATGSNLPPPRCAKIATPSELLAAGYNSNAAKLPLYLKRGGDGWRGLIPRETQMYLQIYKSFESLVPLKTRTVVAEVK